MTYCVSINGIAVRANEISDCFNVVLDAETVMLQISKVDGKYQVTNAVNGWGNNCKTDYENAEVRVYVEIPAWEMSENEIKELGKNQFTHYDIWSSDLKDGFKFGVKTMFQKLFSNSQSARSAQ